MSKNISFTEKLAPAKAKINAFMKSKFAIPAVLVFLIVLPQVVRNNYVIHVMNMAGLYIMLTVSLDLVLGTIGMTQLGHIGFYGIGAYAGAILTTKVLADSAWSFWVSIPVAFLLCMMMGLALGLITLRLQGIFFALCTLGFGEIMRSLFLNLTDLTGGPFGIKAISDPKIFGFDIASKRAYFYLIFIFVVITIWVIASLRKSKYGRFWRAVREDEIVTSALGINVFANKILALIISAGLCGVAGTIFAHYLHYIAPTNFVLDESILVLSMAIVGGRDSIPGAIFGAVILTALPELTRVLANYRMLIYGVGLILVIIFRPEGVMGKRGKRQK